MLCGVFFRSVSRHLRQQAKENEDTRDAPTIFRYRRSFCVSRVFYSGHSTEHGAGRMPKRKYKVEILEG